MFKSWPECWINLPVGPVARLRVCSWRQTHDPLSLSGLSFSFTMFQIRNYLLLSCRPPPHLRWRTTDLIQANKQKAESACEEENDSRCWHVPGHWFHSSNLISFKLKLYSEMVCFFTWVEVLDSESPSPLFSRCKHGHNYMNTILPLLFFSHITLLSSM